MNVAALCDLYLAEGVATLVSDKSCIRSHIKPLLGGRTPLDQSLPPFR